MSQDIMFWYGKRYPDSPVQLTIKDKADRPLLVKVRPPTEILQKVEEVLNDLGSVSNRPVNAVTLSFKTEHINMFNDTYMTQMVRECMDKLRNVHKYMFIADWSEEGRFHMHGVIVYHDVTKIQYCKKVIGTKIGNVKLKPIKDSKGWAEYCVAVYKDGKTHRNGKTTHVDLLRMKYCSNIY